MSTNYSIVVTTYSRTQTGSKIVDALLTAKLAACIQAFPITSSYKWKGKTTTGREYLMLIKSKSKHFRQIKETILENHDYEVPEVVSLRIDRGSAGYLAWIDRVTK
jgi:periplasmic divalent cation tolerance protein